MFNLIRSDFYKILRTKAFYICAIIAALLSALGIVVTNNQINSQIEMYTSYGLEVTASELGYNAITALKSAVSIDTVLLTVIMISMFIPNEFSFGTIKNIISSGKRKWEVYFSKFIVALFIVVSYIGLCYITCFSLGAWFWGTGEITREMYLDMGRMIGLSLFAVLAVQSLCIMMAFLIRQTGGTIACNVSILMLYPVLQSIIDLGVEKLLKVEEFSIAKYNPLTYLGTFSSMDILKDDIILGSIVCGVCIIATTAIGIFTFYKRDVK